MRFIYFLRKTKRYVFGSILILFFSITSACGGVRCGYFSRPYVGEEPAEIDVDTTGGPVEARKLSLSGLRLYFMPDNEIQTSYVEWVGIGVPMFPVYIDLKTKGLARPEDKTYCLRISIKPEKPGIEYNPFKVELYVDGKTYRVETAQYIAPNFTGGTESVVLLKDEFLSIDKDLKKFTYYKQCFAVQKPSPDHDIRLDLGNALRLPDNTTLPVIRFKKNRYRH